MASAWAPAYAAAAPGAATDASAASVSAEVFLLDCWEFQKENVTYRLQTGMNDDTVCTLFSPRRGFGRWDAPLRGIMSIE